mgnify:CR=1 FL=1
MVILRIFFKEETLVLLSDKVIWILKQILALSFMKKIKVLQFKNSFLHDLIDEYKEE